jgi:hypothetical protein
LITPKNFLPSKETTVHRVLKTNHCSISPTIDSPDFMLKYLENLPNLCAVCQALFDEKASHFV